MADFTLSYTGTQINSILGSMQSIINNGGIVSLNSLNGILSDYVGNKSSLTTVNKNDLVDAINELDDTLLLTAQSTSGWNALSINTVTNCTYSSADNYLKYKYNSKYICIRGVLRLRGFTRTGANPSVTLNLPVAVNPTSSTQTFHGVISSLASSEYVNVYVNSNSTSMLISTTETVTNVPNGTWVLTVPYLLIRRAT